MSDFQKFSGLTDKETYILTFEVSGELEFLSTNCQGNIREFCDGLSVATLFWPTILLDQNDFPFLTF